MDRSANDAARFPMGTPQAYPRPSPLRAFNPANKFTASSPPKSSAPTSSSPPTPSNPPTTSFQPPTFTASKQTKYQSPSSSSLPPVSANGPVAETPVQKVARLRAERLRAKANEITTWDVIVVQGRFWADIAHRVTVLGLLGLTVVSAGITIYATTNMIIAGRRKSKAWYTEQIALWSSALQDAIDTEKAGRVLSEEQVMLLNNERTLLHEDAERDRRRPSLKKVANWIRRGGKGEEYEPLPPPIMVQAGVARGVDAGEVGEGGMGLADGERKIDVKAALEAQLRTVGPRDRMTQRANEMLNRKSGLGSGDAGK